MKLKKHQFHFSSQHISQQRWTSPTKGGYKATPTRSNMQPTSECWAEWHVVWTHIQESYGTEIRNECVCMYMHVFQSGPYKENLYEWASWAHKLLCTINPNNPLRWEAGKGGQVGYSDVCTRTHTHKGIHGSVNLSIVPLSIGIHWLCPFPKNNMQVIGMNVLKIAEQHMTSEPHKHICQWMKRCQTRT